jgi:hypothetical protein
VVDCCVELGLGDVEVGDVEVGGGVEVGVVGVVVAATGHCGGAGYECQPTAHGFVEEASAL